MNYRYGWLTTLNRKKQQREMNKLIRKINQNIENDTLWCGRFYVKQVFARFEVYSDKSGADLFVGLAFIDKKTNVTFTRYETVNYWRFYNGGHLSLAMNEFIVNRTGVWQENPRPGSKEWYENITWNRKGR